MNSSIKTIEGHKTSLHDGVVAINLCSNRANLISGLLGVIAKNGRTIFPNDVSFKSIHSIAESNKKAVVMIDRCKVDNIESQYNLPVVAIETAVEYNSFFTPKGIVDFEKNTPMGYIEHYTSGSTGTPQGWIKTVPEIIKGAEKTFSQLIELNALDDSDSIIATVPAQHMYGFENSIMIAMLNNIKIYSGQPFYPQDIANACAKADNAVCLLTTPYHLQTLISSNVEIGNVKTVICATAKLSKQLSIEVESRFNCTVIEIYGSTETGVIGTRKTSNQSYFTPLPGVKFIEKKDDWVYVSDHLNYEVVLNDRLNVFEAGLFDLAGRSDDMIKVAGKRTSLAGINYLLQSIQGVDDGLFYMPAQCAISQIMRPVIFWVPNGINKEDLRIALLKKMDPVFVPRTIIQLDALPRDENGKVSQVKLDILWLEHQKVQK